MAIRIVNGRIVDDSGNEITSYNSGPTAGIGVLPNSAMSAYIAQREAQRVAVPVASPYKDIYGGAMNQSTWKYNSNIPSPGATSAAAQATTRDAYDLQREQATAAGEEERMEALKRMAEEKAGQGFGKGSGMLEGAERSTDVEYRKALASRLGQIDVAELQAGEAKTEAEKARQFAAQEAEKGRVYGKEMAEITQANTAAMARLNQTISQENLTVTDAVNDLNNTVRLKTDAAFASGKAAEKGSQPPTGLSEDEKAAWLAGQSGRSYDDYASERDAQIDYRSAAITSLDPLKDPNYLTKLREIMLSTGSTPVDANNDGVISEEEKFPDLDASFTTPYATTSTYSNGTQIFVNPPPGVGSNVVINGKTYKVTEGLKTQTNTGLYREYQYFTVVDPTNNAVYVVKPQGLRSTEYGNDTLTTSA